MQVITGLLSVYMLILFLRILLSWFQPRGLGKAYEIIQKITEPYLSLFRRIRFLHIGRFDFSPIAAILVLVVLENVFLTIASYGTITAGIFLALIVRAVWSAVAFLAFFYIAILIIRFFGLLFGRNQSAPVWQSLDMIIQPMVFRVTSWLKPKKPFSYATLLALISAVLIITVLLVRFLINLLVGALASLPF